MPSKILLSCLWCATTLLPAGSAQAQDQDILLRNLPVTVEPGRIRNLMLLQTTQDTYSSARIEAIRDQAKAAVQTEAGSEQMRRQEELRKQIYLYGPPNRPRVDIWLRNGRKLSGTIAEISSDSFLLQQKKNRRVTVSYTEVTRGPILRSTAGTEAGGEGAAMVLVLAMYVTARVIAYNATHH